MSETVAANNADNNPNMMSATAIENMAAIPGPSAMMPGAPMERMEDAEPSFVGDSAGVSTTFSMQDHINAYANAVHNVLSNLGKISPLQSLTNNRYELMPTAEAFATHFSTASGVNHMGKLQEKFAAADATQAVISATTHANEVAGILKEISANPQAHQAFMEHFGLSGLTGEAFDAKLAEIENGLISNPQSLSEIKQIQASITAENTEALALASQDSVSGIPGEAGINSQYDFAGLEMENQNALLGDHTNPKKEQKAEAALLDYVNKLLEAAGSPNRATAEQIKQYIESKHNEMQQNPNTEHKPWIFSHSEGHYVHVPMENVANLARYTPQQKQELLTDALVASTSGVINEAQAKVMLPTLMAENVLGMLDTLRSIPTIELYTVQQKHACNHHHQQGNCTVDKIQPNNEPNKATTTPQGVTMPQKGVQFKKLPTAGIPYTQKLLKGSGVEVSEGISM